MNHFIGSINIRYIDVLNISSIKNCRLAYFNGTLLYEPKHEQASQCLKTDHPLKIAD
jgi:hypothetical protein